MISSLSSSSSSSTRSSREGSTPLFPQKPKEYTFFFNPHKELGFYTITEKREDHTTFCRILSLRPQGQKKGQKKHARLKVGTVVLASAIIESNGTVQPRSDITSFVALRQQYAAARKKRGRKLQLWFIDTDDCCKSSNEEDWSKKGLWKQKNTLGWAGGAEVAFPTTRHTEDKVTQTNEAPQTRTEHLCSNINNHYITDAIINGNYKKVISLLQSGIYEKQKDFKGRLPLDLSKGIYEQTQRELMAEAEDDEKKNELKMKLKDTDLKTKVLKIYDNAEHYINFVRHMKCWTSVELAVIKKLNLTPVGMQQHVPDFLFCKVRVGSKKIPDMAPVPFGEFVDFTNIADSPTYLCYYNPKIEMTYKERMLYIDLYKGKPMDTHIKLGTWSIPLENIKERSDDNLETEFEWEGFTTEFLEDNAKIRLSLKQVDHKFRESKKPEAVNGIRKVLDWIDSFRKETGDDSLSTNIMIPADKKISLLHAAIFLEDVGLVNRILSLGADPLLESEIGSPLGLAKSLKQKNHSEDAEEVYDALHIATDLLSNQDFESDNFTKNEKPLPFICPQNSQEQISPNSTMKYAQRECEKKQASPKQSNSRKRSAHAAAHHDPTVLPSQESRINEEAPNKRQQLRDVSDAPEPKLMWV